MTTTKTTRQRERAVVPAFDPNPAAYSFRCFATQNVSAPSCAFSASQISSPSVVVGGWQSLTSVVQPWFAMQS